MRIKQRELVKDILIVIFPIILYFVFVPSSDRYRTGVYSDNLVQWVSVMECALKQFFSGKGMPLYNLYNYGGMEIFDEGYYGLYNPIIWIAFLCSRLVGFTTITMHTILCMILGNVAILLIGNKILMDKLAVFFMTLAYVFVPIFTMSDSWYYVWMNYWIFPMLIYAILMWDTSNRLISIVSTGTILLLALLEGNSQFTMMNYMSYGVVGLIVVLVYNKKFWANYIGSYGVAFAFGSPYFYGLFKASARSNVFGGNNFLTASYNPFRALILWAVPNRNSVIEIMKIMPVEFLCRNIFMGTLLVGGIAFIIFIFRTKKRNLETILGISCVFIVGLWWLYVGGEKYFLASLLSHIPVINGFRYLYKGLYVVPSVILFPAMCGMKEIRLHKNSVSYAVFAGLFVLALGEQFYETKIAQAGSNALGDYAYLDDINEFDRNNYRVLFVVHEENSCCLIATVPYSQANVNAKIQTVGGYDNTAGKLKDSMIDLYCEGVEGSSITGRNALSIEDFCSVMDEGNGEYFFEALKDNSIGYFMMAKQEMIDFQDIINAYGIDVRLIYDNDEILIYKLDDVPMIIQTEKGKDVPIKQISMDSMEFVVDDAISFVNVSERYNSHLEACYIENGKKKLLEIQPSSRGFSIDTSGVNGTVVITYKNWVYSLGIYLVLIYVLVGILIIVYDLKMNDIENNRRQDECNG